MEENKVNDDLLDESFVEEGEIDIFSMLKKKKLYIIEKDFKNKKDNAGSI